jgi:hypothetical protein
MSRYTVATVTLAGLLLGCASRQSAATQTTIKAFDPAASDPKAIEVADGMINALGGEANWNKTKEITWTQLIILDGKVVNWARHSWDRWNGRHQYQRLDPSGQVGVTMHDLFTDTKFAYVEGSAGLAKQMREDTAAMATEASKRLTDDGYRLTQLFKLKDPGVHLKFSEERPADDDKSEKPEMKIDVIQVTFDPGVGPAAGDVYYVAIDKATKMPLQIEHVPQGRPDNERSATRLEDWKESNGLKFATKYTNIGYTRPDAPMVALQIPDAWKEKIPDTGIQVPSPGEVVLITEVNARPEVEEDLYAPDVNKFPQ